MTNEQEIRKLKLQITLDDYLRGSVEHPGARKILCEEISSTPSGRAHVIGTAKAPSARELADELWATETGQKLKSILAEKEQSEAAVNASEKDAELARIQAIEDPRLRINEARKAGLA